MEKTHGEHVRGQGRDWIGASICKEFEVPQDPPIIYVPGWYSSESGLIVPGTVAPPLPAAALPRELRPAAAPVVISRDKPPSGLDQVGVYFAESEAGLEPSRLRDVRGHLERVPFEPAMLALSRIAALAWAVRHDREAQLRFAEQAFVGNSILTEMRGFMARNDHAVLIVEQHAFVVMRLLIERAREGNLDEGLSPDEVVHLQSALLGATSLTDVLAYEDERRDWLRDLDGAVAFFVQNAAYNGKPQPMGELARSRELYTKLARDPEMVASEHYCPLDEWMKADYGFTNDEQLAFGFALSAMTTTWSNDESAGSKSHVLNEHVDDLLVKLGWEERRDDALALLSADRSWYATEFSSSGESLEHIAWELRPLMQRPFLRLSSGGLLLLSPRALVSWITDGFHYRLLDAAGRRNTTKSRKTSRAYTAFAGAVLEEHCLRLAADVFATSGGGAVYPEQRYGKKGSAKTSDIAILTGTDLVLIEVTASRLRADTLVLRDSAHVREDLDRLVLAKARQLDGCINALKKGTAEIPAGKPDVLWEGIDRVWPIVLAGGSIAQNEYVWSWIRRETLNLFGNPKVQPLVLIDVEDFEALMGLVEHGISLIKLLERKSVEPYRDLELAMALRNNPGIPGDRSLRASLVERAFNDAIQRAEEYFDMTRGTTPTDAGTYPYPQA